MGEVGLTKVDGGGVVALGVEIRATQIGEGEVGVLEIDDGVAVLVVFGIGRECPATQVGVGEVGLRKVYDGVAAVVVVGVALLITTVGSKPRASQVGVGEVGPSEVDEAGHPRLSPPSSFAAGAVVLSSEL